MFGTLVVWMHLANGTSGLLVQMMPTEQCRQTSLQYAAGMTRDVRVRGVMCITDEDDYALALALNVGECKMVSHDGAELPNTVYRCNGRMPKWN
jgi:hypothetical protein